MDYTTMTNEELRLEVAKRKGIDVSDHLEFQYMEGFTKDGLDGWDGWFCPRCKASDINSPCCDHWSTDIAAAWGLVEEIRATDGKPNDNRYGVTISTNDDTTVRVVDWHNPRGSGFILRAREICQAQDASTPRAICEAWLQWKDAQG